MSEHSRNLREKTGGCEMEGMKNVAWGNRITEGNEKYKAR